MWVSDVCQGTILKLVLYLLYGTSLFFQNHFLNFCVYFFPSVASFSNPLSLLSKLTFPHFCLNKLSEFSFYFPSLWLIRHQECVKFSLSLTSSLFHVFPIYVHCFSNQAGVDSFQVVNIHPNIWMFLCGWSSYKSNRSHHFLKWPLPLTLLFLSSLKCYIY